MRNTIAGASLIIASAVCFLAYAIRTTSPQMIHPNDAPVYFFAVLIPFILGLCFFMFGKGK